MTSNPDAWQAYAACVGHPTRLFFPENVAADSARVARAKAVCATCPVTSQCLDAAYANDERFGVWGGLDPAERGARRDRRRGRPVLHVAGQPVSISTYNNHGCRCDGCREAVHTWRNSRADRSVSVSSQPAAPAGAPSRSAPLAADPGSPPRTARAGEARRPDVASPSVTSDGRGAERAARRSAPHSRGDLA